ncbi:glycoside hydrolase/deacetylase [Crepidotus variabilis]|uniref:Glycoside hydrolase/deacetylase n=1 Tax=Crepidotus variabilis TaxID=179855 RepID=A0A9P6JQB2_9AGAR|nr:glycoside hydrolase/deacetylase [Crepidotus variabilis]
MPARKVPIGSGVDVDAVPGRLINGLGSYGDDNSLTVISRGVFAGEVGVPRLLKLLKRYNITSTWFIPGHSLETFPKQMEAVRDAGPEIGLHGYSHENPAELSIEQERDILNHTYKLLTDFNNGLPLEMKRRTWWGTSKEGTNLLVDEGIVYDHSSMGHDCKAYYLTDEDQWYKIDYAQRAETGMKPLVNGKEPDWFDFQRAGHANHLVSIRFVKTMPNSHGWVSPLDVEQLWKDIFTYHYREEEEFIVPTTIHPDVSGRPHVLFMLERFIEWINTHTHVHWVPFVKRVDDFQSKNRPAATAKMANLKEDQDHFDAWLRRFQ